MDAGTTPTGAQPENTWVELRVHGVSGTPPEQLLDSAHVRQVDGDERSRFFRPARGESGQGDPEDLIRGEDGHVIEGFHWGRYTSGSFVQSAWVALLPLGLVNLAAFMLPAAGTDDSSRRARTLSLAVLRLLGGLMTLLFSLSLTLTLADVVAVRWLGSHRVGPDWLARYAVPLGILLAGVLLALFGGWSWFARRLGRREAGSRLADSLPMTPVRPAAPTAEEMESPVSTSGTGPLGDPGFYSGDPDTLTLRGLHVALTLTLPAVVGATVGRSTVLTVTAYALLVATLLVILVMGDNDTTTPEVTPDGIPQSWLHRSLWPWVTRVAVLAGAACLMAVVVVLSRQMHRGGPRNKGEYELGVGIIGDSGRVSDVVAFLLLLAVGVAMIALLGAVAWLSHATRDTRATRGSPGWYFRPYSRGGAALAVAGLGVLLGVGLAAAVVNGAATTLTGSTRTETSRTSTALLDLVAYAWGVGWLPVLALVAAVAFARWRNRGRIKLLAASSGLLETGWAASVPLQRRQVWSSRLGNAIWIARLKNIVAPALWTIVAGGWALAVVVAIAGRHLADQSGGSAVGTLWLQTFFVQIGSWTLLGLIGLLVSLVRTGARDGNVRRTVNIVWDVVAFWPHAVHPFIPTPYSMRAVGDLAQRIRDHVASTSPADGRRHVVVCAHSQGSLISFAALQLVAAEHGRVGLLTFGSQLRVIFPRAFPMYFNHGAVLDLYQRLDGAWVNLYRDTDPLAGPVLSWRHTDVPGWVTLDGDDSGPGVPFELGTRFGHDWRLTDPVPRLRSDQLGPIDALHKHSLYWTNPVWSHALGVVRSQPEVGGPQVAPPTV